MHQINHTEQQTKHSRTQVIQYEEHTHLNIVLKDKEQNTIERK
jgi:hypothetical protein